MGFFDNLKKSAEGLMNQGTSGNIRIWRLSAMIRFTSRGF